MNSQNFIIFQERLFLKKVSKLDCKLLLNNIQLVNHNVNLVQFQWTSSLWVMAVLSVGCRHFFLISSHVTRIWWLEQWAPRRFRGSGHRCASADFLARLSSERFPSCLANESRSFCFSSRTLLSGWWFCSRRTFIICTSREFWLDSRAVELCGQFRCSSLRYPRTGSEVSWDRTWYSSCAWALYSCS